MRVMFLGFAVPDALFQRVLDTDKSMPVQTQRFGWSVIKALRHAGVDVDVISAEPTTDFPHNSRLVIRGRRFREHSVRGETISFVNFSGLKHVTRYLTARWVARGRGRSEPDAILVHGVHSPFLWAGVRLARKWGVPVVAILTDAPSLRAAHDNSATLAMKRLDRRLILRALAALDGVITLAPALSEELAPGRPCLFLEGIAPEMAEVGTPNGSGSSRPLVVYAGGLNASYGITDLLASVNHAQEPWDLRIYGRGPAASEVRLAAERSEHIEFAGSVGPDEMPHVYGSADVLVNPRPPDHDLAARSFPSKLLEYLATGVPVVSTALPTLPADYRDHLVIAEPGARGLAKAIDRVVRSEPQARCSLGQKGREFILSTRGSKPQGAAIKEFIRQLQIDTDRRHR